MQYVSNLASWLSIIMLTIGSIQDIYSGLIWPE